MARYMKEGGALTGKLPTAKQGDMLSRARQWNRRSPFVLDANDRAEFSKVVERAVVGEGWMEYDQGEDALILTDEGRDALLRHEFRPRGSGAHLGALGALFRAPSIHRQADNKPVTRYHKRVPKQGAPHLGAWTRAGLVKAEGKYLLLTPAGAAALRGQNTTVGSSRTSLRSAIRRDR